MTLTKKQKITIGVVAGIILIAVIGYFMWKKNKDKKDKGSQATEQTTTTSTSAIDAIKGAGSQDVNKMKSSDISQIPNPAAQV